MVPYVRHIMTTNNVDEVTARTFRYERNRVARRGGQRASSFRFGSTRPIVAMEEEAVSQAAEGVTHGTDSHVLISDEWFALKTARRAVFALCSMCASR